MKKFVLIITLLTFNAQARTLKSRTCLIESVEIFPTEKMVDPLKVEEVLMKKGFRLDEGSEINFNLKEESISTNREGHRIYLALERDWIEPYRWCRQDLCGFLSFYESFTKLMDDQAHKRLKAKMHYLSIDNTPFDRGGVFRGVWPYENIKDFRMKNELKSGPRNRRQFLSLKINSIEGVLEVLLPNCLED